MAVSILLVSRQFTDSRFASCVIDDSILQMSWVQQFSRSLQEGTLVPRWLPDSNGGYGSPVFVFYSPLVYYVTAPLVWLTQSVVLSMKLVRLVGLFLSGLAMYYFASSLGGRKTGLATALVYVALPFHVLDVSYWSLYAGTWAWIWFPLILHGARLMFSTPSSRILSPVFVLSYGALVLTHLLSAYLFSFVIVAYCLCLSDRSSVLRNLSKACANAFASLALVAFYLLPAIYEQRFVHIEYSTLLPEFDLSKYLSVFPEPRFDRFESFPGQNHRSLAVHHFGSRAMDSFESSFESDGPEGAWAPSIAGTWFRTGSCSWLYLSDVQMVDLGLGGGTWPSASSVFDTLAFYLLPGFSIVDIRWFPNQFVPHMGKDCREAWLSGCCGCFCSLLHADCLAELLPGSKV